MAWEFRPLELRLCLSQTPSEIHNVIAEIGRSETSILGGGLAASGSCACMSTPGSCVDHVIHPVVKSAIRNMDPVSLGFGLLNVSFRSAWMLLRPSLGIRVLVEG